MPRKSRLTPKQATALKGLAKGMTGAEVGVELLGHKNARTGSAVVSRMLASSTVREELADAFDRAGLSPDAVARAVMASLDATREYFTAEGVSTGGPDHHVRLRAAELAARLWGAFPSTERAEREGSQVNVAVAILPAVQPRDPDAPVYILPPKASRKVVDED